jgi:2-polyprenyl-3-methyl-5-hydroxy-6-metoxy-1,4-benzoquinol methylase
MSDIYTQLEDPGYKGESVNRMRTANLYLDWVSRFLPPAANLLDIGCSTDFLITAKQAGWNVTGLGHHWAAHVSGRLPGTEIIASSLAEADFPAENFDVITMWDVIEHLPYPSEALSSLHRWLKPSGWLFLNTQYLQPSRTCTWKTLGAVPARAHLVFLPAHASRVIGKMRVQVYLLSYKPGLVLIRNYLYSIKPVSKSALQPVGRDFTESPRICEFPYSFFHR